MASIIKADNIQKVSDGSNIIKKCGSTTTIGSGACSPIVICGSTVTLGRCGGTVTLASGATQTGFGRTGTVDWCTTAKTAPFTGVSGKGYFVNTTCGAVTVTLPATPSAGDIISLKDYANTWQTNNVTLANNSSKINGICGNADLNTQDQSVTLIYVDSTKGWRVVQDSTSSVSGAAYITATGGTITTSGDYKIHTFTSDGTFCVSAGGGPLAVVDYLVVAGGGSGGEGCGGGGGAGGFRESYCATTSGCYTASPLASATSLPVSIQSYPITVGGGGAGVPVCGPYNPGNNGSNSVFSTITSAGGGGGGGGPNAGPSVNGNPGGSGGGGQPGGPIGPVGQGGTGNTPPTSPPQGQNGGNGFNNPGNKGGGGGGAGAAGNPGTAPCGGGGPGGAGVTTSITASPVQRAGGGGGASSNGSSGCNGGAGGGGPAGYPGGTATAGTVNTGSGGGGGGCSGTTGAGGSGIVIIRYKFQ